MYQDLPCNPNSIGLCIVAPNFFTELTYHTYCITYICVYAYPVKDIHQDAKHPLGYFKPRIWNNAVIHVELVCQTLHVSAKYFREIFLLCEVYDGVMYVFVQNYFRI